MQEHLIVVGVLRREDRRILWAIHVHRTRETDERLHHELLDHLHDAVVLDHAPASETAALASLALAVGLDRRLFPRSDRSAVRHRMREVAARCLMVLGHKRRDGGDQRRRRGARDHPGVGGVPVAGPIPVLRVRQYTVRRRGRGVPNPEALLLASPMRIKHGPFGRRQQRQHNR